MISVTYFWLPGPTFHSSTISQQSIENFTPSVDYEPVTGQRPGAFLLVSITETPSHTQPEVSLTNLGFFQPNQEGNQVSQFVTFFKSNDFLQINGYYVIIDLLTGHIYLLS